MSNKKGSIWTKSANKERDEVEELLGAAEDDVMLKLSLNSHLSHTSSPLDQDLIRRFEALKSPSVPSIITTVPSQQQRPTQEKQKRNKGGEDELEKFLGTDLSTRFAALKGSASSTCTTELQRSNGGECIGDDQDEDEVEKVMRWAMDAARLDPSSKSDSEDDDHEEEEEEEEEEEDDDDDDDDRKRKK